MISTAITVFAIIAIGALITWYLFDLYSDKKAGKDDEPVSQKGWYRRWAFTPKELGGFSYHSLILLSFFGLFLELLMIRWISAEIRIFSYFKNFVLIAAFLGFGLGCYLSRRSINLLSTLIPVIFIVLLIKLPIPGLREVVDVHLSNYLGASSQVDVWGQPRIPMTVEEILRVGAVTGVAVPLFLLISITFVPVGQLLGWYLENAPHGVLAYTVNVIASLAGILFFTLICFLETGPVVWFSCAGIMLVILVFRIPILRWSSLACYLLCIALLGITHTGKNTKTYWSPYQKLTVSPWYSETGELLAYNLKTNDFWYQWVLNLSDSFVEEHPKFFEKTNISFNPYNLPYHFHPNPESVLVLGAGMGNDVAAALRNGADKVTAVEIDPTILEVGSQLHPEKPYDSPKVETVTNDARNYVENTSSKFDMIVFALLDSHTTSSHYTNIRIDNYVYTIEALKATRALLEPDGVMVVKFQVNTPWIAGRLENLLTEVFGYPPIHLEGVSSYSTGGRFFITGDRKTISKAMAKPSLRDYMNGSQEFETVSATVTTDDWPYFYQKAPGVPTSIIIISCVLVLATTWAMIRTGWRLTSVRWHFFLLGAGFMLLEVHIVSKMALLFGTTWVVNSIVISGLLLMIVAANLLVMWKPKISVKTAYIGLFGCLLVSYVTPPEMLFFDSLFYRIVTSSLVFCSPVFFAGIVFIRSFAEAEFSGRALGANLIGSLVGGLLEALSLWTGIKALLLVAGLLYLLSMFALRRERAVA